LQIVIVRRRRPSDSTEPTDFRRRRGNSGTRARIESRLAFDSGFDAASNARRYPSTVADIMPSRIAWPRDRDCGLIVGDRCSAVFGFGPAGGRARGVEAVYQTFFQLPQHKWTSGLELVGLDGILALRSTGGGIHLMLHRGGWEAGASFEPMIAGEDAQYVVQWARDVQAPGVMLAMIDDLIGAIEADCEPYSSGRDGRAALEMIASVFESHRRGATVSLPLENRDHVLRRWVEEAGN